MGSDFLHMAEFANRSPIGDAGDALVSYHRDSMLSSSRRTVIDIQKEELKKEKDTIEDLKHRLESKDDTIANLTKQMEETRQSLQSQLQENLQEIALLNETVVTLRSEKQLLIDDNTLYRKLPDEQAELIKQLKLDNEKMKSNTEETHDKLQASLATIELLTELKNSNEGTISGLQQDIQDQHLQQQEKIETLQQALDAGLI